MPPECSLDEPASSAGTALVIEFQQGQGFRPALKSRSVSGASLPAHSRTPTINIFRFKQLFCYFFFILTLSVLKGTT